MTSIAQQQDQSDKLTPFNVGSLNVESSVGHKIYFAEFGDRNGPPIVLIHGTALPFNENQLEFVKSLSTFRVILFHQRGVGLSTPRGEVIENSTELTIKDMETLRTHLGIENWTIFGWSLGSVIATRYAQEYSNKCNNLLLAGVFLATPEEYQNLLQKDFETSPGKWDEIGKLVGLDINTQNLTTAIEKLYTMFCSTDFEVQQKAMQTWLAKNSTETITPEVADQLRVSFHYRVNGYFVDSNRLIERLSELGNIRTAIITGTNDTFVSPKSTLRWQEGHGRATVLKVDDGHMFNKPESQKLIATLCVASTLIDLEFAEM